MISADTNLFVYLWDLRDPTKNKTAQAVVEALSGRRSIVGLQVVGEYQNALHRRLRLPVWVAAQSARNVLTEFSTFAYDEASVETALVEASAGRLSYWDALLLAAADSAGVKTMISEDMGDGLIFRGLEVVNPFGPNGPSDRVRLLLGL
jgi:predicted nucleic acid-binding protein